MIKHYIVDVYITNNAISQGELDTKLAQTFECWKHDLSYDLVLMDESEDETDETE